MDATYKTNRYALPLLEIVGVTSTNNTFCVAFVFLHKEKECNYTWALNCLKSTMDGCMYPRVIVTDRELAAMNACNNEFPDANRLLCRWHINRAIFRKCRRKIRPQQDWSSFNKIWRALVRSTTMEAYTNNLNQLNTFLLQYPGINLTYISK